ncbi:MAG: universal stress protein [Gemmatimonadetes bacterium]|jgi:nucleotide-binding universal stress UspA family protein|nr:universal stress protein [Gemmatimonadota bacterium]MBT6145501.1 universal stress protein [Gemmatimonadota bacterium]MBT7860811.1 universal stress protein [Gemmatimonadota bacterium]
MAEAKKMRIMVGYSAHFTSDEVLRVAKDHARAFDATLYLVSSVVGHTLDESGHHKENDAAERIEALEASLKEEGLDYEFHLVTRGASAGEDLVKFAEAHQIDEIVMGFKKRSAIGEMVFGSNYRFVIAFAPCPVVTVHNWS